MLCVSVGTFPAKGEWATKAFDWAHLKSCVEGNPHQTSIQYGMRLFQLLMPMLVWSLTWEYSGILVGENIKYWPDLCWFAWLSSWWLNWAYNVFCDCHFLELSTRWRCSKGVSGALNIGKLLGSRKTSHRENEGKEFSATFVFLLINRFPRDSPKNLSSLRSNPNAQNWASIREEPSILHDMRIS